MSENNKLVNEDLNMQEPIPAFNLKYKNVFIDIFSIGGNPYWQKSPQKHSNFLENQAEKVESWGGFQSLTYFTKKKTLNEECSFP